MVVLDEDRVEEPHAVVRPAAGPDCVLLQHAERRRGLPRVEHHDSAAGRVHKRPRLGGDAGQALEKVQSGTFGDEQRARRAHHLAHFIAGAATRTVRTMEGHRHRRVDLTKRFGRDVGTGQHALALDQEHATSACPFVDRGQSGHVTRADIFGEGPADDVAIVIWVEWRHTERDSGPGAEDQLGSPKVSTNSRGPEPAAGTSSVMRHADLRSASTSAK